MIITIIAHGSRESIFNMVIHIITEHVNLDMASVVCTRLMPYLDLHALHYYTDLDIALRDSINSNKDDANEILNIL